MLIVIAQPEEIQLVKDLGFENNPILITGIGGINVINALKDLPKDTEILNIGFVGSQYYQKGTIVEIVRVRTNHEKAKFFEQPEYLIVHNKYDDVCSCYTSSDFVTKTEFEEPCVFDMELAYIKSMFPRVRSIKVVSDNLNKQEYDKTVGE